ncbi:hypothetical protein ACYEXS_35595 [Paenibacillus sp. MAH-36]|uniref:Uncharacterized protein n=1 Tax=Paenibacillus violae TaxID=3077234 RepID=A0ABU3RNH7_9BACL|nr:hypothetical protein [Paenibacillus sp. PFR10]MDU0205825.1 hypothetical protein [Paenibacillus sp. PFR10]
MAFLIIHSGTEEIPIVITNHAEEKMRDRHLAGSVPQACEMVINAISYLEDKGYIWSDYRFYDYYEIRDFRAENACAFVVGFEQDLEELNKFGYSKMPDQIINIVTWFHKPKEFYLRSYNYKEILVKKNQEVTQRKDTYIIVIEKNGNVINKPMDHNNFELWFNKQYPKDILPICKSSPYWRVRRIET